MSEQFDPSMMMGGGGQMQAQAPPQQNDAARGINDQVRQLIMMIGKIAQSAPEAQPEFEAAAKALLAGSMKIVAAQQQPQGGQPMVAA